MPLVPFWEQPSPIVKALQKWVEKDLKRDIHDVLRIDFAQEAVPSNKPLVFSLQFADKAYMLAWLPEKQLQVVEG